MTIFGAVRGILLEAGVVALGNQDFINWATPMARHTNLRELRKGHYQDFTVSYRGYVSQARLCHT